MRPRIALVVFALALLSSLGTAAATRTWNGPGGFGPGATNWSNPANWDGGLTVPQNGDALVFPALSGGYYLTENDLANTTYDSMTFPAGVQTQVYGQHAVTLTSSNPLRVFGAMTLDMPVTLSAPGTVVITVSDSVNRGGIGSSVQGIVTLTGNTLDFQFGSVGGGAAFYAIEQTAPSSATCHGLGFIDIWGHASYSGYSAFGPCDVWVPTDQSLGAAGTEANLVNFMGSHTVNSALRLVPPGDPNAGAMFFSNDGTNGPFTVALNGSVEVTYEATFYSSFISTALFNGKITGAGGVNFNAHTIQLFNHSNDYAGGTTLSMGELDLMADEVIPDSSDLYIRNGYLRMGSHRETVRNFLMQSEWDVDLNGAVAGVGYPQVVALQGVALTGGPFSGHLVLTASTTFAPGTVITLIDNRSMNPVGGTFVNLPEGATVMAGANTFVVSYKGGDGNDVTLTVPGGTPAPTVLSVQDMWWAGSAENGWGMSIVQHGEKLFSVVYAYDANGKPTWFVFPSGTWDATKRVWSGALYTPHGTPFFSYDASRLAVGQAVGSATLTFSDDQHVGFDYAIGASVGHKSLTRQSFGAQAVNTPGRGDMWWGGINQNGWGIALLQQFNSLFAVWFTYDATGTATWYVMPAGTWTNSDNYEGRMYSTTGSPWVGRVYNPSQLAVTDVGPFKLHFLSLDNVSLDYNVQGKTGSLFLDRQPF